MIIIIPLCKLSFAIFYHTQPQVCAACLDVSTSVKRLPLEGLVIVLREESLLMIQGLASVSYSTSIDANCQRSNNEKRFRISE